MGVFATEFWRRGLMPVTCSYRLTFACGLGRALVFPALVPDFHRLPFATCFGTRIVGYRLSFCIVPRTYTVSMHLPVSS